MNLKELVEKRDALKAQKTANNAANKVLDAQIKPLDEQIQKEAEKLLGDDTLKETADGVIITSNLKSVESINVLKIFKNPDALNLLIKSIEKDSSIVSIKVGFLEELKGTKFHDSVIDVEAKEEIKVKMKKVKK